MEQPAQWGTIGQQGHQTAGSDTESNTIFSYAYAHAPCSDTINAQYTNGQQVHHQQHELVDDCVSGLFNQQSTTSFQNQTNRFDSQDINVPSDLTYGSSDDNTDATLNHRHWVPDSALAIFDSTLLADNQFNTWDPQTIQQCVNSVRPEIWTSNNVLFNTCHSLDQAFNGQEYLLPGPHPGFGSSDYIPSIPNTDFDSFSNPVMMKALPRVSVEFGLHQGQSGQFCQPLEETGQIMFSIDQLPPSEVPIPATAAFSSTYNPDRAQSLTLDSSVLLQGTLTYKDVLSRSRRSQKRTSEAISDTIGHNALGAPSVSMEQGVAAEYSHNRPRLIYNSNEYPYRSTVSPTSQNILSAGNRLGISSPNELVQESVSAPSRYVEKKHLVGHKPRRAGPLTAQGSKDMAAVRSMKACFRCRQKKYKCDVDSTCKNCAKPPQNPRLPKHVCIRQNLEDYLELFFPLRFESYFSKLAVEKLLADNVAGGFTSNTIEVFISSGPSYPPISLSLNEFRPVNDEFLIIPVVNLYGDADVSLKYAPPYGLTEEATRGLEEKWSEHIEAIINTGRYEGELLWGDTSIVSWEIYEAICEYWKSTKNLLVWHALRVYTMHFDMSAMLLLTEESADKAIQSLRAPEKLPYQLILSSRLVSKQMKHVLCKMLREECRALLLGLRKAIQSADKSMWPACYCAISILCMCGEKTQIDADLHVVYEMRAMHERDETSTLPRAASIARSTTLEHGPIAQCIKMFHEYMRSYQGKAKDKKNQRGYNPIRDGLQGADQAVIALVNQARHILVEHDLYIDTKIKDPSFADPSSLEILWSDHFKFREANNGRLVCTFLRSFLF